MPQPNPAVPTWVEETPEVVYQLLMHTALGTHESIDLTRREYNQLKRKLARRRGYLPKPDPNVPNDAASVFERGRKLVQEANNGAA